MRVTLLRSVALTFGLAVASLSGCKQGEGEVCQIDTDCESGLKCIAGTMRCQKSSGEVPVDAAPSDASIPDAGIDAGIDAMPTVTESAD